MNARRRTELLHELLTTPKYSGALGSGMFVRDLVAEFELALTELIGAELCAGDHGLPEYESGDRCPECGAAV